MISIIIPVCNEELSIGDLLEKIREIALGKDWEIIVVDDGSTDKTPEIIGRYDFVTLINHPINKGYGASLKRGIIESKFDVIATIDADGTYPVEIIPDMYEELKNCDMVVGSRTKEKAKIPLIRKPAKWLINKLANYLVGYKIPDLNSGLRIFRKKDIAKYFKILPNGFSFTTTITIALLSNNYRVKFIPIEYYKRKGHSKFRPIYDTLNFIKLLITTVLYFDPLKIFLPLSMFLFSLSFLALFHRIIFGKGFLVTSLILFISAIQVLALGLLADLIDKRNF